MPLWFSFVLIAIGFLAIFIEFFVPAAGIIGIVGLGSIIVAVILSFVHHGSSVGMIVLFATVISTPFFIGFVFKIFPKTFIGKRLILSDHQDTHKGYRSYTEKKYEDLLGKEGIAITTLRPSGMARMSNAKYSVISAGEFIEKGTPIKVIKIEGSKIVVRTRKSDA